MNHSLKAQTDSILGEIFNAQRDAYLIDYSKLSNECDGGKEVLLSMDNASELELFRMYRPDCLLKDDNGEFSMVDYNSNTFFNHDHIEISFNETLIELHPFHWNSLKIDIKGDIKNNDQFILWGEKWIDVDDQKELNKENGFNEVIHSISIENYDNERLTIVIDLGTSPTSALIELINILQSNGATKIIITQ